MDPRFLENFYTLVLTFQNLAFTFYTLRFNIQIVHCAYSVHLCVLYSSQNKQRLLAYTGLTACFS
jgi:hypothetical protein